MTRNENCPEPTEPSYRVGDVEDSQRFGHLYYSLDKLDTCLLESVSCNPFR